MSQYDLSNMMGGMTAAQAAEQAKVDNLLPAGDYVIALTDVKVDHKQRPKAPAGVLNVMLRCTFAVQEGQYQGRTVRAFIAVDHDSEDFVKMGRKTVSELAVACGHVGNVSDLEPFKYKPVFAKITVSKAKNGYDPNNNIGTIRALGAGGAPAMPSAPKVQGFQAPAQQAPVQQAYAPPPPAAGQPPMQQAYAQAPQAYAQPPMAQPQQPGPALGGGGTPPWKQ